jgi:hypothetical protein
MRAIFLLLLLGLALLPACDSAPPTPLPAPGLACVCQAPDACPANVCDVQIEIAQASCKSQVGEVELMLGKQLDPRLFQVGQAQRTCATIPRGTSLKLWARASRPTGAGSSVLDWQWVEDIACPAQAPQDTSGPTIARVLECNEATAKTNP